jgi:hypothetical protein
MANIGELPLNIVRVDKPKLLAVSGLNQKGTWVGELLCIWNHADNNPIGG